MEQTTTQRLESQLTNEQLEIEWIEETLKSLGEPDEGPDYYLKLTLQQVLDLRLQLTAEIRSFLVEAEMGFREEPE